MLRNFARILSNFEKCNNKNLLLNSFIVPPTRSSILSKQDKRITHCYVHTTVAAASQSKMFQTKIGQFFKKKPEEEDEDDDSPAPSPVKEDIASPVKKPELKIKAKKVAVSVSSSEEDEDKKEEDDKKKGGARKTLWKIGGGGGGDMKVADSNGKKRKSKNSSSDDEEVKSGGGYKKQRKRIVVESSSENEEEDDKMEVKEEEVEAKEEIVVLKEDEAVVVKDNDTVKTKGKENGSGKLSEDEDKVKKDKPKSGGKKSVGKEDKKSPKLVEKKKSPKLSPKEDKKKTATSNGNSKVPSPKKTEDVKKVSSSNKPFMAMMGGGANPKGWNDDYDPSKSKYDPIEDASWKRNEKVPYLALAKTLEAIEATSSRLKFIEILANYFRSVILLSPGDLLMSIYLCLNKLAPAYEGVELGVAETNVMKAIAQATGRTMDRIKADAGSMGDLGLVAENSRTSQKTLFQPQPLTIAGVFTKLKEIASMSGQASHAKKISMITSMLVACKHSEARYLTRSLLGKLRIGLAEQSLLQAISQATFLTPADQDLSEWPPRIVNAGKKLSPEALKAKFEEHAFKIKTCYCECPNYDILVKALVEVGIDGLSERCKLTPGVPPRPMLAQPTKGVADVLDRFDGIRFTCEYKYDGERAQLHLLEDGSIRIYSRNQEDNTSKYPDIISRFKQCIKGDVKSCIIDSEAVAWDIENESILPFQVLSTRKRKDANETEIKVQVCVFAFDLIYLNGESLVTKPLVERRELLRENFQAVKGQFTFATSVDTNSMEEVQEFLEESVKGNCEGLMVKTLDERASYELAKRSQKWLKLKKDYMDSGGDSLDLVVIGGFLGKGKRAGTYGGFLLACYDPSEEVFQTICKIGTGFSDEDLQKHSETLKDNIIPNAKSYYRYNQQHVPDHWFDATQVWEVKCADLSLSPVHTAAEGLADPQRGISLRFPRFLRIRDDKNVEDATSSKQVCDMYKNQEQVKNLDKKDGKKGHAADDDEFY